MRQKPTSYLISFKCYANFSESQSDCEKLKTANVSKLGRHHNNFFFRGWVEEAWSTRDMEWLLQI